jgi:hypothetical protein
MVQIRIAMNASIVFLLLAVAATQATAGNQLDEVYTDPDVYSVYSVVVNDLSRYPPLQQESTILIRDHTVTYQKMCSEPNSAHREILAQAIADYTQANGTTRKLLPKFSLDKFYELVAVDKAPARPWVELSSVGFNRQKDIAVVTWGIRAGPPGSEENRPRSFTGSDFVLRKKNGRWQSYDGWTDAGCVRAS